MPQPGDTILCSASLISMYGQYPITHSCTVEIRNAAGAVILAATPMTLVTGSVYRYDWVTTVGTPTGAYQLLYKATLDGAVSPEVAEVVYLEQPGLDPTVATLIDQIWYATFCHRQESFTYDSQGRTEKVITKYSTTSSFAIPAVQFEWNFSYDADNNVDSFTVLRTSP